jgi:hypothetical protein
VAADAELSDTPYAVSNQKGWGAKEAEMKVVGCDLHAKQQTIAMVDTDTGVLLERTLVHEWNAVREFYAALEGPVVVGIEATGSMTAGVYEDVENEHCYHPCHWWNASGKLAFIFSAWHVAMSVALSSL